MQVYRWISGHLGLTMFLLAAPFAMNATQAAEMDADLYTMFKVDKLEWRAQDGSDAIAWEAQARVGDDYDKYSISTQGEYSTTEDELESSEWQFRYQRLISDFFDAHIGLRFDPRPRPDRSYALIGFSGLAPQWFEVDANLFVNEDGDSAARLEAEYDILFTQRLALRASTELDLAFARDPEIGVGAGFNNIELGLRLSYEVTREIAPYIGVHWERLLGASADLAEAAGGDSESTAAVIGVALLF